MALRNIVKGSDPLLRKKSRPVTVFDTRLHTLLDDMVQTLHNVGGAGLAAVQVGALRRVFIVDVGEGVTELINPVITSRSAETESASEGCLSFPGEYGMVERPLKVTAQAQDRFGDPITVTGEGLLARAICHEYDHLEGIVYKDLATEMFEEEDEE